MRAPSAFRQRSLTSLGRRARQWLARLRGARLQPSHRVFRVEIGDERFKRIVLHDSALAERLATTLQRIGPSASLPRLVVRYEREVWVDFVDGVVAQAAGEEFVRQLARFYGDLYARSPSRIASAGSRWVSNLADDLDFARRVGVIDGALARDLAARALDVQPTALWTGFDYIDPVLKNFVVRRDGQLCAVDIGALGADTLLGTGVAKALARWMEPHRATFLSELATTAAPDIASSLPFVELAFEARYTKTMFLERKWKRIDVERFRRLSRGAR